MSIELMLGKISLKDHEKKIIPDHRLLISDIKKMDYKEPAYRTMCANRLNQEQFGRGSDFASI